MATTADARLIADAINNLTKAVKAQTDILKKQETTVVNNVYNPDPKSPEADSGN